jgi:hypothetical protein
MGAELFNDLGFFVFVEHRRLNHTIRVKGMLK